MIFDELDSAVDFLACIMMDALPDGPVLTFRGLRIVAKADDDLYVHRFSQPAFA